MHTKLASRSPVAADRYDAVLVFCGYEARATGVLRSDIHINRIYALVAAEHRELEFDHNLRLLRKFGATLQETESTDGAYKASRSLLESMLDTAPGEFGSRRPIGIDISSMPRRVIAAVCLALRDIVRERGTQQVDFLYNPGEFYDAPHYPSARLEISPVSRALQGTPVRGGQASRLAIGLGYEPSRTRAALEYLEPSETWFWIPVSPDERYDVATTQANVDVISHANASDRLPYQVDDPPATFLALESFWFAGREVRTVLLPMGPKIFALCCILLGLEPSPDRPAVWRLGASVSEIPVDVRESARYVALPVSLVQGEPTP